MTQEIVWGGHFDLRTDLVDVHVSHLRNRVNVAGEPSLVRKIRGAGYLLVG